jgi:hypothetical protein
MANRTESLAIAEVEVWHIGFRTQLFFVTVELLNLNEIKINICSIVLQLVTRNIITET